MEDEAWRSHKFIRYADEQLLTAEASRIAAYVLNRWLKERASVGKFRRLGRLDFTLVIDGQSREVHVRFDALVDHIRHARSFNAEEFGLPPLQSDWLDYSLGMAKPDAPIARSDFSEFAKFDLALPFGPAFPLRPCIDREGAMFATFQTPIQQNIVALHHRLVENGHQATSLESAWRNDLRLLINESVSLIDITLHQLYFMAQYRGQERGWTFDPDKLGRRHGQPLKDKLRWVGKITGRPLDDAAEELAAFHRLRVVRNHFNHFDPPCVAYTVEDVVGWLNDVPQVGRLAWKIRDKADTQLSRQLVEILTLPRAEFVARFPDWPRVPQGPDVGYASVVWPDAEETGHA